MKPTKENIKEYCSRIKADMEKKDENGVSLVPSSARFMHVQKDQDWFIEMLDHGKINYKKLDVGDCYRIKLL